MVRFSPLSFARSTIPEPGIKRAYVTSSFVGAVGGGMLMTIGVLYFTKVVGLPAAEVGLVYSLSGLMAIPLSIPAGDLADRLGSRRVVTIALAVICVSGLGYLLVRDFWTMLVVNTLMVFSFAAYYPSVGALLRRVGGEDTVVVRSQARAAANLGITLGSLFAGIGIVVGTPAAYRVLVLLFGIAQVVALLLLLRVPDYRPLPRSPLADGAAADTAAEERVARTARWIALRDKAFVVYSLVAGTMAVQALVLEIMVPVWIVGHTHAPGWSVTLAFALNTALVVLLQVQLGNKVRTVTDGGSALRRAGVALLVGCAALGQMTSIPAWAALVLLVFGIGALTLGAIWHTSGMYAFEFGLPPAFAQGQYQGLSSTAAGAARAVAPVLLLGVVLGLGRVGWIGLGVVLFLLGLTGPAVARWGERTRPATVAASEAIAETT